MCVQNANTTNPTQAAPKLLRRPLSTHLQAFDAVGQRRGVGAALAARGVDVALDGVVRLVAGLVQRAQVHPGGGVAVVQLHGADVGLQGVHGLVLLLVQHPEDGNGEETVLKKWEIEGSVGGKQSKRQTNYIDTV